MKKIVVALLTILYVASTSGAIIHLHYCMGKLVSSETGDSHNDLCVKCGMSKKDGSCCKDVAHLIKVQLDHQKSTFDYGFLTSVPSYIIHAAGFTFYPSYTVIANTPARWLPPALHPCPLFISNRNLRV